MPNVEYAILGPTTHCNLDCSFCNRRDVIQHPRHASLEQWGTLLDKLADQPLTEVKLLGLGEPFMHPAYDELCRMLKERFPTTFLGTATNGQYRMHDVFRRSLRYLDELVVSIDGYGESYERDRRPAKWSKLLAFLADLKAVDRQGCDIQVNYVVNPGNVDDIAKVQDLAADHGISAVWLNIAQNWAEDGSCDLGFTEEQIATLKTFEHRIKGRAPWTYSDCFWPVRGLYVDVYGDVKVCCLNTSAEPMGNLYRQSLAEIHSNPRFEAIREGCRTDTPTEHCARCSYKEMAPLLDRLLPGDRHFVKGVPKPRVVKGAGGAQG